MLLLWLKEEHSPKKTIQNLSGSSKNTERSFNHVRMSFVHSSLDSLQQQKNTHISTIQFKMCCFFCGGWFQKLDPHIYVYICRMFDSPVEESKRTLQIVRNLGNHCLLPSI